MNNEMRLKLGVPAEQVVGTQLEDLLTVGSKIFFQTHFYPLIKMQNSAREIYLSFKGVEAAIPVLLNVEVIATGEDIEIHCGGMEISNRSRFEKELLEAKKTAEDALTENAELISMKNDLLQNQQALETQYRQLRSLQEQQRELFKLISHDLQEPLRKSIFFSDYLLNYDTGIDPDIAERLSKIMGFSADMKQMLLTLQQFEELQHKIVNYDQVALTDVIATAIESLEISDDASVNISYSFDNPVLTADRKMLTRLFEELFRNSLKNKNPENNTLEIEISAMAVEKNIFIEFRDKYQYERFVKITYTDNGLGFDRSTAKMFKIIQKSVQFNQVSLGLAYCKRIVEKHIGNMVAKSVRGKGVGYTIFLPGKPPVENISEMINHSGTNQLL